MQDMDVPVGWSSSRPGYLLLQDSLQSTANTHARARHTCCAQLWRSRLMQTFSCRFLQQLRCPPHRLQLRLLFHFGLSYRHRKGNTAEEFPFLYVSSLSIVWRLDFWALPLSKSLWPLETLIQTLISRSSTKAPLAAAGKPGRVCLAWGPKELGILHCPRQMPAQLLCWRDDSARQHGLMRFDQGIERPWSLVSFFVPV